MQRQTACPPPPPLIHHTQPLQYFPFILIPFLPSPLSSLSLFLLCSPLKIDSNLALMIYSVGVHSSSVLETPHQPVGRRCSSPRTPRNYFRSFSGPGPPRFSCLFSGIYALSRRQRSMQALQVAPGTSDSLAVLPLLLVKWMFTFTFISHVVLWSLLLFCPFPPCCHCRCLLLIVIPSRKVFACHIACSFLFVLFKCKTVVYILLIYLSIWPSFTSYCCTLADICKLSICSH